MDGTMRKLFSFLFLCCQLISSKGHPHSEDVLHVLSNESHLFYHLLDDHHYVRHLRPAAGNNDTLTIKVDVHVTSITDLDERSQELGTSLILKGVWEDYRLAWNDSDYGGITSLELPASMLWKPDFTLLHSMYGSFEHFTNEIATVTANGEVTLSWHYKIRSYCPVNIANFPFDSHICHVTLVDASHTSKQIRFQFIGAEQDEIGQSNVDITVSSQWEVVANSVRKTIGRLMHPEMMDYFSVSVRLNRKSQFYHCMVVGPAVLTALLVPVIFLLPVGSSGKITLGGCTLISLLLSMKLLCDVIGPNRSAAPTIAIFYLVTMGLSCVSIIMAAIITSTASRSSSRKPVPSWMNRVFLGRCGLRRLLCMDPYSNVEHGTTFASMKTSAEFHEQESDVTPLKDGDTDLKEVSRNLRMLIGRYSADQEVKDIDSDWREIVLVVDRLLLLMFTLMFAVTSLSLFS